MPFQIKNTLKKTKKKTEAETLLLITYNKYNYYCSSLEIIVV